MAPLTGGSGEEGTFGEIYSLGRKIIFTKLQLLRYTTKKNFQGQSVSNPFLFNPPPPFPLGSFQNSGVTLPLYD